MKELKKIIIIALKRKWIDTNPFDDFKIKTDKIQQKYLLQEELDLLLNREMPVLRLEHVKDCY